MKTHNLTQGSPAWLAYRATHFNASDAPAMLGMSPYKTRTELLHELHTGLSPEVNEATQRLFDAGHAAEAAARPVAEREIGEELYPVVGSEGKLSASFDGLTMDGTIAWEHKLLNIALLESLDNGIIPDSYRPQLEQQLMVSGAEKVLFMATSPCGTAMECVWYTSNPELRSRILQGWTQFAIDLAAYVPVESVAKPVGRSPETLPALRIEVTGMVTASNLAEYKAHALAVFGNINRELVTDQDFASAESTVKWCSDIETRLAAAKQHALSQTESIDTLFRTIDDISAEARATRLELDKLVKARKEAVRVEIVSAGAVAIAKHIESLNVRLGKPYMPHAPVDFASAIKGKRTIDSLNDAVNTTLANAKIAASAIADRIQANLNTLRELAGGHAFLFADTPTIVLKANDDLVSLIKSRIADHAATEAEKAEALRASIQAEEKAKAEKEAREKLEAEQAADAATKAALLKAQEEAKPTPAPVVEEAPAAPEASLRMKIGRSSYVPPVPVCESVQVAQTSKQKTDAPPTLALGEISTRLGFNCTSAFLATLGFEATTVRAAKLYQEDDFWVICAAVIGHIKSVQAQFETATA